MNQRDTRAELYMDDDTTPVEVLEFVAIRTANPAILRDGEVLVFNYHNHPLDAVALGEWATDADPGIYHVTFQVSGVWAFIQRTLPKQIRDADVLAYRRSEEAYADYVNWRRVYEERDERFEDVENHEIREQLAAVYRAAEEVVDDV